MRKKGFTLVELLAVIAIIGLVATIAVPIILDSVNTTKEKAFLDNAKSLNEAANTYYQEQHLTDEVSVPLLVTYSNGKATNCNNKKGLDHSGKVPDGGNLYIDSTGKVEMKVYDKKTKQCIVKSATENTPHPENIAEASCKLTGKTC